jgi:hypothetical protein
MNKEELSLIPHTFEPHEYPDVWLSLRVAMHALGSTAPFDHEADRMNQLHLLNRLWAQRAEERI